ncbi:hypothetical protein [Pseudomonas oryzihabitans]|nr:hypothetical protein [Pseudomonas oryzihabitans]
MSSGAQAVTKDAVAALELRLSEEEIGALEAPYVPHPVVGFS